MLSVLYVCTHNRCRSILSEAITNTQAQGIIEARSAGSNPADAVHPLTLKFLMQSGYDTTNLTSKSWDNLGHFNPDVVITVCDNAAGEACPLWLGSATKIHWALSDPSKLANTNGADDAVVAAAFEQCIKTIEQRVADMIMAINSHSKKMEQIDAISQLSLRHA